MSCLHQLSSIVPFSADTASTSTIRVAQTMFIASIRWL